MLARVLPMLLTLALIGAVPVPSCLAQTVMPGSEETGDVTIGSPNASVTLIEHASLTSQHSARFAMDVWPQIRQNYVDSGRVRFILREFPTPPNDLATAEFQVARCHATADEYYDRVQSLFNTQGIIIGGLEADAEPSDPMTRLRKTASSFGLSEQQINECIADPTAQERVRRSAEVGESAYSVVGAPTFLLNGRPLSDPTDALTYQGLSKDLDAALSAFRP
jgi:protein-disulfide isomerase